MVKGRGRKPVKGELRGRWASGAQSCWSPRETLQEPLQSCQLKSSKAVVFIHQIPSVVDQGVILAS